VGAGGGRPGHAAVPGEEGIENGDGSWM
jgi:hypothetical protein